MDEMIGCCGLICTKCAAFIATKNDDASARRRIATSWSKHFGMKFEPEDINCDGCLQENGRRSGYYRKICEIRPCAQTRNVKNCAYCEDYACEKLKKFFAIAPRARATLNKIRKDAGN